jgi:hypothetical protein
MRSLLLASQIVVTTTTAKFTRTISNAIAKRGFERIKASGLVRT